MRFHEYKKVTQLHKHFGIKNINTNTKHKEDGRRPPWRRAARQKAPPAASPHRIWRRGGRRPPLLSPLLPLDWVGWRAPLAAGASPLAGSGRGEGAARHCRRLLGGGEGGRRTPLPPHLPPSLVAPATARHCRRLTSRCRSLSSHHHTPLHRQPTQRERNRERGERMRCRLEGIRIWMVRTCRLGSI